MAKQKHAEHVLPAAEHFLHKVLVHVTGALGLLISISFFTATYDTAQVKLTLLHMGGLLLAALWASLQITRRKSFLTKQNLPVLLPILVYLAWNILCYIFAPLHTEAAEEFIRFLLYGIITLLAATEFDFNDIKLITKWILLAVWISFIYAAVQVADGFFPGFDPMPWRGFFTKRIFSTHANPNFFADFVIFSSCILGGVYLANRQKKYLVLGVLGLITLFFTESKGAWLAYTGAATLGVLLYTNYCAPALKKYRLKINTLVLVAALGVSILAGIYTVKRFQSVSFRTHTWLATLEMIKDHPIMGVGVGNFKTVYAAYRRPQIFYIENSHNVETQHAENELLEQGAVSGIVGLLIFLWLMYRVFGLAVGSLRNSEFSPEKKFYLLGYTAALGGILAHSLVDISIRFASSGFFFALFMGLIISLCRPTEKTAAIPPVSSPAWVLWAERLLLAFGLVWLVITLIKLFHEITSALGTATPGDVGLLAVAWVVFVGALLAASVILLRAAWQTKNALAIVPLCLVVPLEFAAYCPFQANHYYSLGISFNNMGNVEGALGYFTKAVQLNPLQAEYRQFRANLFMAILDLTNRFSPIRGDTQTPSDDFSRALADYAVVERRSPNHPLLHHNKGQLYYKMALTRSDQASKSHSKTEYDFFKQDALDNMANAKKSFVRALQSDPTNPETYMYLVQIGLLENNVDEAQQWLNKFRQGPEGVTEEEFLKQHQNYPLADQLQQQVNARRAQQLARRER